MMEMMTQPVDPGDLQRIIERVNPHRADRDGNKGQNMVGMKLCVCFKQFVTIERQHKRHAPAQKNTNL